MNKWCEFALARAKSAPFVNAKVSADEIISKYYINLGVSECCWVPCKSQKSDFLSSHISHMGLKTELILVSVLMFPQTTPPGTSLTLRFSASHRNGSIHFLSLLKSQRLKLNPRGQAESSHHAMIGSFLLPLIVFPGPPNQMLLVMSLALEGKCFRYREESSIWSQAEPTKLFCTSQIHLKKERLYKSKLHL